MPLFAISNQDKPNALSVRLENRPAHVEYLKALGDRLVLAGPYLGADGESMVGTLVVADFADEAAARDWMENDPYARAGLFARSELRLYRKVLPAA